MESYDVIIIGGGPAGLAGSSGGKRRRHGEDPALERDHELGGS